MEEKNCELGRLGQRLKMNEEHNARCDPSYLALPGLAHAEGTRELHVVHKFWG